MVSLPTFVSDARFTGYRTTTEALTCGCAEVLDIKMISSEGPGSRGASAIFFTGDDRSRDCAASTESIVPGVVCLRSSGFALDAIDTG